MSAGTGGAPEDIEESEEIRDEEDVEEQEEKEPEESESEEVFPEVIHVTRCGKTYHIEEGCPQLTNHQSYPRFDCCMCSYKVREMWKGSNSSSSSSNADWKADEVVITAKDRKYHHPTCTTLSKEN